MKAELLNIRLFLEGSEVPVVSATVSCSENMPVQASIQIIALDEAVDFYERTMVHLFVYAPQPWDKRETDEWKLLFMGEILGFRFVKNHAQRAVILQCADFSNYWDTAKIMNIKGLGRKGQRLAAFAGANTEVLKGGKSNIFGESGGGGAYGKIVKLLSTSPSSFPKLKGLLGGIIHLLESIGGFYYGEKVFKGFNDFLSIAELRVKLMQQIHAAESDDTSMQLLNRKGLKKWVKGSVGNRGAMESFNKICMKMMQLVYHKRQSIPCPPYFPGDKKGKLIDRWTPVNTGIDHAAAKIYNALRKVSGSYDDEKTMSESDLAELMDSVAEARGTIQPISRSGDSSSRALRYIEDIRRVEDLLLAGRITKALDKLSLVGSSMIDEPVVERESVLDDGKYERVGSHVFKPDIFFSAPPKCNVLFPELYNSFEFSRSYLEEPTRLMLHSGSQKSGDIFGGGYSKMSAYFAPDIPSVRNSIKLSSKKFATHIMEHELFPGIIPTQVQIPWAKVFKVDVDKGKKKFQYIQRMANHEYFKNHYMSRTGTASGRLNINFLPGFPVLIIDKPINNLADYENPPKGTKDREKYLDSLIPPQYLAYCNNLTHTVTQGQEGGSTNYSLSMIRSHKEDGRKLGISGVNKYTKTDSTTKVSYVLLVGTSKDFKYGPHGYKITKTEKIGTPEITRKYWEPRHEASTGEKQSWVKLYWTYSRSAMAEAYGKKPALYKVTELISSTSREVVEDIGLEGALTPPWLAKVWHASKISDTYHDLFGVGAITEEMGIDVQEAYRRDKEVFSTHLESIPDEDTLDK